MDVLKEILSNNPLFFSISEQEQEFKVYSKEDESNSLNDGMCKSDLEGNYGSISISSLKNNSFSYYKDEDSKEKDHNFLDEKRKIENDNNFEDNQGELILNNNEISNEEEEEVFHFEKFDFNEFRIEDKEKDGEIKEEEKNTCQKVNDIKKIKLTKKPQIFSTLKIGRNKKVKNTRCGRKRKEEKDKGNYGNHTRDSSDNKILKIKSYFWKSLYIFIRDSFKEEKEFLKSEVSINKNLKKKFNEDLFKMTLKDIYLTYNISNKYHFLRENKNKILINKIYEEQKETNVIKILNLTYIEAFNIFRRKIKDIKPELKRKIEGTNFLDNKKFKDFDCFIEKIREEEKNENGDIEEYINSIKQLCLEFEDWFGKKIGRNKTNNEKKKKTN